jgi:DNA-binding SARP family transcriptional activator
MLRVWLLGVLRLEIDGVQVAPPPSRRARLLVAMLALERRPHSRETLAAWLWPGGLDRSARASLRTALAQLRASLGPDPERFLSSTRERVVLAGAADVWTDVGELDRLLGEGRVQAALGLWSGELLTGLEDDWVHERRDELRQRVCDALGPAAGEAEAAGDLATALLLTRRQVELDALAEEPQRELIRRLANVGDRAAALVTYDKFAQRLRDQLGMVPSAATRELADTIRAARPQPLEPWAATGFIGSRTEPTRPQERWAEASDGAPPTGVIDGRVTAGTRNRLRFNLPAVAASFTGREADIDALDDAFGAGDRAVITQAITGLGGVGKSQLAARYVQQRADGYDVVAWIRAEDGGIADLAQLAARAGAPVDGLSASELAQLALDWLGDSGVRWLLVLDNVTSPEQLQRCCPRSGRGRVLVTSRDRALRQFGPVHTVDVFDEDTAAAYLTERAGRPGDRRAARQLAVALGCLPLALSHAAAYCQSGTSFADYLALLGALPARELFDSHPELSYAQTVASTWKASIHAASSAVPVAADVLAMAAHLGPDAIPKSLWTGLGDAQTAIERKRLADALNALARFSLATVDDDTVSVHRLLQKTIRDAAVARDDRRAARRALAALHRAFPTEVSLPPHWPACEQLLPHVLALADALDRPGDAGPQLIDVLIRASRYLHCAEPGRRDLRIAQIVLARAERILGAEHPDTLMARNDLAASCHWVGHSAEAIAIYEALLADHERILGANHPATLTTRNNLGYTYRKHARIGEAITLLEPLLADRERILGGKHPDTLTTWNNLARGYTDIGRIGEAIAILEPLLDDHEQILGPEHPSTLLTRHNLALAYLDERAGDAIAVLEPLLVDIDRILGTEHPHTLRTRHTLALAYLNDRRVGDAIALLEAVLPVRERIQGAEHPDVLAMREHLAGAYRRAGRANDEDQVHVPAQSSARKPPDWRLHRPA